MSDPDDSAGGTPDPSPSESGETVTRDESVDAEPSATGDAGATVSGGANATDDADGTNDADAADVDAAPNVETILEEEKLGESRRLDPKVRYQWLVGSLTGAVIGGVCAGVAMQILASSFELYDADGSLPFGFARLSVYLGALALVVFVLLAVLRAVLYYRSWRYEVRTDSLYLTRGVFTRVQTVAPYVRVQHVDTRRSPVERLLGLSSLVVYTAGSRGADVTIPGLTDERAAELQSHLKRLAIASEEEDAV